MAPNDFNSAFSHQLMDDLPTPPVDPRMIAYAVLQRSQWRTRILACLSIFFWLVAAAGMLLLVYGLNRFVIYIRIAHFAWDSSMPDSNTAVPTTQPVAISDPERDMLWGTSLIHHSMPYIACSIVALMLAALFTVLLVFSSRRATLTRINLSLMQISEELRQMRQAGSTSDAAKKL